MVWAASKNRVSSSISSGSILVNAIPFAKFGSQVTTVADASSGLAIGPDLKFLAVIESPRHLIQIGRKILSADFVPLELGIRAYKFSYPSSHVFSKKHIPILPKSL